MFLFEDLILHTKKKKDKFKFKSLTQLNNLISLNDTADLKSNKNSIIIF